MKIAKVVSWHRAKFITSDQVLEMLSKQLLAGMKIEGYYLKGGESTTEKLAIEVGFMSYRSIFLPYRTTHGPTCPFPPPLQTRIDEWVVMYSPTVSKGVNEGRNYLSTESRKDVDAWMVGKKGRDADGTPLEPRPCPTPAAIKKMMLRDLTVDPPQGDPVQNKKEYNRELFAFFVDKLLPNGCGP